MEMVSSCFHIIISYSERVSLLGKRNILESGIQQRYPFLYGGWHPPGCLFSKGLD